MNDKPILVSTNYANGELASYLFPPGSLNDDQVKLLNVLASMHESCSEPEAERVLLKWWDEFRRSAEKYATRSVSQIPNDTTLYMFNTILSNQ